eukprot:TRINITY_DN3596_c0_g1_i1.p1 TRINITY_DN3596_c0_g1~~TRINITY_DN3596_c0_g1_i1.p1  ORF type:complete len:130 (-),score=35.43 TRINITY_DN3596_c0_g1_i1:170-559(-)
MEGGAEQERDFAGDLAQRQRDVNGQLNMGNHTTALKTAISNPPLGCRDQAIKDNSAQLVVSVLMAIKEADIKKHVDPLPSDELDVLMKYVYKGLEDGENSTALLKWHAIVTEKGGLGCIVRAIAERRTI